MIGNQSDLKVLSIKDYIKNPKESGYKSYHMLVSVPIFLSDSVVDTKVEIQIAFVFSLQIYSITKRGKSINIFCPQSLKLKIT